jgi:hypothetical protein
MFKYSNCINAPYIKWGKIGFKLEPNKEQYAQSTFQKMVTSSYSDVADMPIIKQ